MLKISEVLLILFIGILLGTAFNYTWPISNFLQHWQTLTAGLLALLGATWTVLTMQEQLNAEQKRHIDQIERKSFAVRAQMPDALSSLISYTQDCFDYLFEKGANLPQQPTEHIAVFKNSLEFIDNQSARMIFELISFYQVHNARLESHEHPSSQHLDVSAILDTVELNFYITRIFEYARNETNKIPDDKETYKDMVSSLRSVAGNTKYYIRLHRLDDVMATLKRRYPTSETDA